MQRTQCKEKYSKSEHIKEIHDTLVVPIFQREFMMFLMISIWK